MENKDMLPDDLSEVRYIKKIIGMNTKEHQLFKMYAKDKGWTLTKGMRVCMRAVILMEYKKANSLEEAIRKAILLDIDGRLK